MLLRRRLEYHAAACRSGRGVPESQVGAWVAVVQALWGTVGVTGTGGWCGVWDQGSTRQVALRVAAEAPVWVLRGPLLKLQRHSPFIFRSSGLLQRKTGH